MQDNIDILNRLIKDSQNSIVNTNQSINENIQQEHINNLISFHKPKSNSIFIFSNPLIKQNFQYQERLSLQNLHTYEKIKRFQCSKIENANKSTDSGINKLTNLKVLNKKQNRVIKRNMSCNDYKSIKDLQKKISN
jgi:CRISPR/Cas system-associated protein Cas5 (RAMP superfamily)